MTSTIRTWILSMLFILSLFSGEAVLNGAVAPLQAAESNLSEPTILSINVEGNRHMDSSAVLERLHSKVGQALDRRTLSHDIQRLFRAGFFSDIRFTGDRSAQGIHLTCHVKEYPLIAKLTIKGNTEHKTKDLLLRLKLKSGRIFNPANRAKDLTILQKGYLKDGYYQVHIDFIPTLLKDGRVDLLIRIHEGDITRINRIHIIGNKAFSDDLLRKQLLSKQQDLLTSFTNRDVFDQKRFGADGQMLQQYYMNRGYLDMKIESKQIAISEDRKSFSLTFSIHEGLPYTVSSVDVQGDLVPDKQTLEDLVTLKNHETYVLQDMQQSIASLTERVGDEGYAFATVTPLMNRNIDDHTIAVVFDIEKGEEVYVERVQITGNDKSDDSVVRRLITQSEGARYSGKQMKTSKEALGRAPFVKDIRISMPKASASDKVNMNVAITEKKTGSISGGLGFSQREKLILTAKLSESNLFGKGYQASLNGTYGRITQDVNASFTNPNFMDTSISVSASVFVKKTDPLVALTYQTDSKGASFGIGVPITHELVYGINYQFNSTNLTQVPTTASLLTLSQVGKQTIGELIQSISWDSRDRLIAATKGHLETFSFGLAGLGGSSKFWETSASTQAYFALNDKKSIIFNPSFSAGMIQNYAQSAIPLFRRYSLGGIGSMRGFDTWGLSVRDPLTNEALGGDKKMQGSINVFFPPPFTTQTSGVRGVVFVDAGIVWGSVHATIANLPPLNATELFAISRIRYTAGFGIEWLSPVGPISLAWAFPIKVVKGDVLRSFEFGMGASF